jgi:GNAT superfamily N-acetyltransferase
LALSGAAGDGSVVSHGIELRTIIPAEREAVLDLLHDWLGDRDLFARYFRYDPSFRDDLCFVAVDAGRIVSTLQVFRRRVRLNGAVAEVAAVGNVFTAATHRERGISSALLQAAIAAMEPHGFDLSLLFAVRLAFYGRAGWQSHVRHLVFLEPAPLRAGGRTQIEPFERTDLETVMRIYDAYNGALSGSTVRDRAYWLGQVQYAGNPREDFLVARRGGEIVAYARGTPLYDFYVVMEHGCVPGAEEALADLICRLHAREAAPYPGTITQLAIAPDVQEVLRSRGLAPRTVEDVFWMWRIVSCERLAAKIGVPVGDLERDDVFFTLFPPHASVFWISDRF